VLLKQRKWINRALPRHIDAVVQVRRRASGIVAVAHIAEDIAGHDEISGLEITESVQVGIVMHLTVGTEDPNHVATEPVFAESKTRPRVVDLTGVP